MPKHHCKCNKLLAARPYLIAMEENSPLGFDALPREIQEIIMTCADLDVATVLRVQAVSVQFKSLCWQTLRKYNTRQFVTKERTPVIASYFINRLNPNLIRRIDFTQCDNPFATAYKTLKKFPNLQCLYFNEVTPTAIQKALPGFNEKHPGLCEISFSLRERWECSINNFRCDIKLTSDAQNKEYRVNPLLNYSPKDLPFIQQDPIYYNKAYHRGGTIGDDFIVIGATDGTLTFLALDTTTNSLIEYATYTDMHKECINAVWSELEISIYTYVASSDGVVSAWTCVDNEPRLVQTCTFPESIMFVCELANRYILAAGKQTLYICDAESNMIVREVAIYEDVTGLFSNAQKAVLATQTKLYEFTEEDLFTAEILQKKFQISSSPNIYVYFGDPQCGGHPRCVTVQRNKVEESQLGTNLRFTRLKGQYDTRPILIKSTSRRELFTVSSGPCLVTTSLYSEMRAVVSPRISRSEIDARKFPVCNSFWYDARGEYLFGLYSNNALYWWHLPFLHNNFGYYI